MHDAPTKGAVPAEPMKRNKMVKCKTLEAVVSPTQGDAPAKKVANPLKKFLGCTKKKGNQRK